MLVSLFLGVRNKVKNIKAETKDKIIRAIVYKEILQYLLNNVTIIIIII